MKAREREAPPDTPPRIWGDFNNVDEEYRVRLDTVGSLEDLDRLSARISEGVVVVVYDDSVEALGTLERHGEGWLAKVDWATAKDRKSGKLLGFVPPVERVERGT